MTRALGLLACLAIAAITWGLWHEILEHAAEVMRWIDTVPAWALVAAGVLVLGAMLTLAGAQKMKVEK